MTTMKDKVCIVTGANAGIGRVTALEIAKMGAKLVIVCRSKERGEEALKDIRNKSNNDSVELILADMASQKSIKNFAEQFKAKYDKLDVLVNNAGLIIGKRELTEDGIESTFAINHMGYFITTHLLLDMLKESPAGRIVNVASEAHRMGTTAFDDINCEKGYNSMKVYGQSKFNNILFTYELAKRIKEHKNLTVNCLHPGVIGSNFGQTGAAWFKFGAKLLKPFFLTNEQGAETQIYLATSPEVEGVSGKYFDKKKPVRSSKISYDENAWKKLWEISEGLVKIDLK
jgi:NAD(P)-dependent dehydrogenase (short-subunit alcohol dehydrogenase family)